MFTRFIAKYASILKTDYPTPRDTSLSMISLKNPDGNFVFIILNQSGENKKSTIFLKSQSKFKDLYKYLYNESIPSEGDFALDPVDKIDGSPAINLALEKRSITVLTTKLLKNNDWGIIK
jgi:hypothetical protein